MEQKHTFLDTISSRFGISFFVGGDCLGGVFLMEVDVAHGVIYLIQVFLVFVGGCHALEVTDSLFGVALCHHFGHGNASIELQFVRRIETYDMFESFVCLLSHAYGCLKLPHEIPFASFLLTTHLMLDDFAQIWDGLRKVALVYIVICVSIIPFFLGTPMDAVSLHVSDDIFSIILPSLLNIAFCQPGTCSSIDGWLCGVETAHIGECGGCALKISFVKLGTPHEKPCFPKKWIVFFAT